jgi:glycosyltransferase involved in cell wall biosynthesis
LIERFLYTIFNSTISIFPRPVKEFLRTNGGRIYGQIRPVFSAVGKTTSVFISLILGKSKPKFIEEKNAFVPFLQWPEEQTSDRVFAFFLPQFHEIDENNLWWGKGFTEWSNVRPAKPLFEGHRQPHIPIGQGYYDLSSPGVLAKQANLAKNYGISGFCFYFYWFAGKTLLESPLKNYLEDTSIDREFVLCWANENWTRAWDGADNEILIEQRHSDSDDLAFISYISKYLIDARYLKIDAKPVVLIYRPDILPDLEKTTSIWRQWCRDNGIGEIYIAVTNSFSFRSTQGIDGVVDFAPNGVPLPTHYKSSKDSRAKIKTHLIEDVGPRRPSPKRNLDHFGSAVPSWDNTPRKGTRGTVFTDSSRKVFSRDLRKILDGYDLEKRDGDKRLVFINAWNEWAEGAHLEPDLHAGYSWLQTARDALSQRKYIVRSRNPSILVVTHDCHPHGAQFLALNLVKTLKSHFKFNVYSVSLGGGKLEPEFKEFSEHTNFETILDDYSSIDREIAKLFEQGVRTAIVNSVASAEIIGRLSAKGIRVVTLIHEMTELITDMSLQANCTIASDLSDTLVFPSKVVEQDFLANYDVDKKKIVIKPQGIYQKLDPLPDNLDSIRAKARKTLDLPSDKSVIIGVGYADFRKGFDLFLDFVEDSLREDKNYQFIWLGNISARAQELLNSRIGLLNDSRLRITGFVSDVKTYLAASDVFFMSSREDPFPSVVLEAAACGIPSVCFRGATGTEELSKSFGTVVELGDWEAIHEFIRTLDTEASRGSIEIARTIREEYNFLGYLWELLAAGGVAPTKVSVIVPNYNSKPWIEERVSSILKQEYPIFEIVLLDDASTDGSFEIARDMFLLAGIRVRTLQNPRNVGSVTKQWEKGVQNSTGDLIWIAESDDSSKKTFLTELVRRFDTPSTALAYSESETIDEHGRLLSRDYKGYSTEFQNSRTFGFNIKGEQAIIELLSLKNTIPNVSGVLFKRKAIQMAFLKLNEIGYNGKYTGDWLTYVFTSMYGDVAFVPENLNIHRRHKSSLSFQNIRSHIEEVEDTQLRILNLIDASTELKDSARAYIQRITSEYLGEP